jgi:hypothetical protein
MPPTQPRLSPQRQVMLRLSEPSPPASYREHARWHRRAGAAWLCRFSRGGRNHPGLARELLKSTHARASRASLPYREQQSATQSGTRNSTAGSPYHSRPKKAAGFTEPCGFYRRQPMARRLSLTEPRDQSHANRPCVHNKRARERRV